MSALGSWHFFCVLFAKAMKYKYKFKTLLSKEITP